MYLHHVKMADSRPLEDKHGHAVNPHANAHYWSELGGVFKKYKFKWEAIFGSDEVRVLARGSEREQRKDLNISNMLVLEKIPQ